MRLAGTQAAVRRVWTVELRPLAGGPRLFCVQCRSHTPPVDASSARAAALAHLAGHARAGMLPAHLRTCQCRLLGCCWHPRSRGCGGRFSWLSPGRPADAPGAWPTPAPPAPRRPAVQLSCRTPGSDRAAPSQRHALCGVPVAACRRAPGNGPAYGRCSPTCLPRSPVHLPAGRLLALQCALRSDTRGHVTLADGLLRGMRLRGRRELWLELSQAGWLETATVRDGPVTVRLLDATVLDQAPGRGVRRRAAHWALHPAPLVLPPASPAALRLTALVLASLSSGTAANTEDMGTVSRMCGHSPQQTKELLDRLVSAHSLAIWRHDCDTDEVLWQFP